MLTTKNNIILPDLSYQINGALFDVHNEIGGQVPEKYIQKAVAASLTNRGLSFEEQYHVPITFQGTSIGRYYLDFIIENCVILELKRGRYIPRAVYAQANKYLDALNLPLAIVGCFATDAVVIKRIINHNYLQT